MNNQPPKLFHKFFRWYCHPRLVKPIEGDLLELYEERVEQLGKRKADRLFIKDTLLLFRKGIIRPAEGSTKLNHYGMIKHNLKFSWRNLTKQKGLFAINIFGLAAGIATCLMITLFIMDELSYDRHNAHADRIARVILKGEVQGEAINEAISPAAVAPAFKAEFPEVQEATRLKETEVPLVNYGGKRFRESRFAYVDSDFFSVFTLPFIKGDPTTALTEPNTLLITKSEAAKYFGEEDPMGKILVFEDWNKKFEVTGVIDDIPGNSHFHFDLLGSMTSYESINNNDWLASDFHSYVLIKEGSTFSALQQ